MDLKQKQCDCTDKCLGYLTKTCTRKEKQKRLLFDIMRFDEELGLYDEPKQETLEEAAKRHTESWFNNDCYTEELFIEGAKWQAERMYSEEDIDKQIQDFKHDLVESTSNSLKQLCSGAILGLNRLKQFKNK